MKKKVDTPSAKKKKKRKGKKIDGAPRRSSSRQNREFSDTGKKKTETNNKTREGRLKIGTSNYQETAAAPLSRKEKKKRRVGEGLSGGQGGKGGEKRGLGRSNSVCWERI